MQRSSKPVINGTRRDSKKQSRYPKSQSIDASKTSAPHNLQPVLWSPGSVIQKLDKKPWEEYFAFLEEEAALSERKASRAQTSDSGEVKRIKAETS
jgi:hypothetical protein